ncbi:MAG: polyphosphate polymerase domain-containing protein [Balneolaceae bacterium]|nr:MAG: polyphosphate polymerase domain-containing protein [Balneolaceae bacterium]
MGVDRLQKQRFEYKYRISEAKAEQIRLYVQNYLVCDEYGATQPNLSYPVNSLYLDSPDLKTFQDTINGDLNRFKLRIRYYEYEDTPVYFEIKRRHNKVIMKKRAQVRREAVSHLLSGRLPDYDHLIERSDEQMEALEQFSYLQALLIARPQMHVSYFREAYELEHSNSVRVTFDRDVRSNKKHDMNLLKKIPGDFPVFGDNVILEIKFTNRYPHWLQELTQLFHLRQESAAKYVDSVESLMFKKIEMA